MCSPTVVEFVARTVDAEHVTGRRVLEVGALDVNGSARAAVEALSPAEYLGVDIEAGPGVDRVVAAEDLVTTFGAGRFDLVISTELLEHVADWRAVVHNLKAVLAPGGRLVLTTRSWPFEYHGYPFDFWRWEVADLRMVFADFDGVVVEPDPDEPGVLMVATRPAEWDELDLAEYRVRNVLDGRRVRAITPAMRRRFEGERRAKRRGRRTRGHAGRTKRRLLGQPLT